MERPNPVAVVRSRPEFRAPPRGAAAGVVTGFGSYFLVQNLSVISETPTVVDPTTPLLVVLSCTLIYAGCWLLRSDLTQRCVTRIALYSVVGFVGLLAIAIWLSSAGGDAGANAGSTLELVLNTGTVGASSGLLVGLTTERQRRRLDRSASESARTAERAEERLAFFNRLLRHHMLNGLAVIRGHAELLTEGDREPTEELERIKRRSDELADLVQNVETLGRAFTGELPSRPVDPVPPLRRSIETSRRRRPDAEVRTDLRDVGLVLASERLDVVFDALLDVAVGAAEGAPVTVTTTTSESIVSVAISVDGPPLEDAVSNVDPSVPAEGALELYIATTLIDHFGGDIDTEYRTDEGNVLTVRLSSIDGDAGPSRDPDV